MFRSESRQHHVHVRHLRRVSRHDPLRTEAQRRTCEESACSAGGKRTEPDTASSLVCSAGGKRTEPDTASSLVLPSALVTGEPVSRGATPACSSCAGGWAVDGWACVIACADRAIAWTAASVGVALSSSYSSERAVTLLSCDVTPAGNTRIAAVASALHMGQRALIDMMERAQSRQAQRWPHATKA